MSVISTLGSVGVGEYIKNWVTVRVHNISVGIVLFLLVHYIGCIMI